jgi:hypothetical protein
VHLAVLVTIASQGLTVLRVSLLRNAFQTHQMQGTESEQ